MTTFAVFGMSENWAREEAREHTPTFKNENGKRIDLSITEWEAEVLVQIAKIMAVKKCVRLSPFFDAPQYAQQFVDMARKSIKCRDLKIRTKAVLVDAKGKPIINPKTGVPKIGLADWAPESTCAA
ncbi:hypothetical protein A9978_31550 [Pseudomonas sp. UMC65]|uniref:hypothetical protein n=1 Tax=unclassified Pseudomonas TaxID=196821 RepID=UPI0015FFFEC6|nr:MULTISPECIES: hypothetical protein [unclassified Pseudomonas]MBB1616994.1 hypothetical protein [Pseudomonas sp. UMC65]MBB1623119.1 hypothetical protein [Pseudomonas sp. UME65]